MPRCTLRQAARALGCSLSTLRRRIAAGELQAVQEDGPHGPRWVLDLEPSPGAVGAVLERLERSTPINLERFTERLERFNPTSLERFTERLERFNPTSLERFLERSNLLCWRCCSKPWPRRTRPRLDGPDTSTNASRAQCPRCMMHQHLRLPSLLTRSPTNCLSAAPRAREAEVQAAGQVALARGELEAYRRALAENAASLAEREARARAAEALAQDLQSRMEQEQMRQAAEVQDLRARLARVPGWLRRLLGVE